MLIVCILIVDDVVCLGDTAESLQKSLRIVTAWGRGVRIRWNAGSQGKSAVMVWGRGRMGGRDMRRRFKLGNRYLPVVKRYKYGGLVFSNGGGCASQVELMREKALRKGREIVGWCRAGGVTGDVACRVPASGGFKYHGGDPPP